MCSVLLRDQLETTQCVPSGIPALDSAIGGLPRGAITEICGATSSGRTSVALSILASVSGRGEVCALVDGTDAFDPESGAAAGIDLGRLLWVRCRKLDQVLRSTDLLLQGGGFGAVALDLSDLPQQAVRSIPLSAWFRFQRAVENTPTLLVLIGRESTAKSAAALVLRTNLKQTEWKGLPAAPTHGVLLANPHLDIEILRIRHGDRVGVLNVRLHSYS